MFSRVHIISKADEVRTSTSDAYLRPLQRLPRDHLWNTLIPYVASTLGPPNSWIPRVLFESFLGLEKSRLFRFVYVELFYLFFHFLPPTLSFVLFSFMFISFKNKSHYLSFSLSHSLTLLISSEYLRLLDYWIMFSQKIH